MVEEIARQVILAVVWAVLISRAPFMLRDRQQRSTWLVLAVFAAGAIVIQSWFGTAVNRATGIAHLNDLIQGLSGIVNAAVMLGLAVHLASGHAGARRSKAVRLACALVTVAGMTLTFALTPAPERFSRPVTGFSPFTVYALLAAVYMIGAAGAATWIMGRQLPRVRGWTLYAGLLMVTAGNAMQVPFMAIRTLQRVTPYATPELLRFAFVLGTVRFMIVPLGCVIAALEPVRRTVLYCYRRARLYSLWFSLRSSTEELTLGPLVSRWRDLRTVDDAWERLHRRVIEIRDSILYLHDTWVWPELLEEAARYAAAAPGSRRRVRTIACWLETARQSARAGAPKLHRELDTALLPELVAEESTMHREMRSLLRLHRAMRSRPVQAFASSQRGREISAS